MMTGPIIYNIVNQSVIARTCITQLKQEVLEEDMFGKKHMKQCNNCGKEHKASSRMFSLRSDLKILMLSN